MSADDPAEFLRDALAAGAVTDLTTGSAMALLRAGGIPTTRASAQTALHRLVDDGDLTVTERPGRRAYAPRETA